MTLASVVPLALKVSADTDLVPSTALAADSETTLTLCTLMSAGAFNPWLLLIALLAAPFCASSGLLAELV